MKIIRNHQYTTMGSIRLVLTNQDLLKYISDFCTDSPMRFIEKHRNRGFMLRELYKYVDSDDIKTTAMVDNLVALKIIETIEEQREYLPIQALMNIAMESGSIQIIKYTYRIEQD